MPTPEAIERLRSMVLSAVELRELTQWEDPIIEEWLNLFDNIVSLAEAIDEDGVRKIEEIDTDFTDGSIPFADSGKLIEENPGLTWLSNVLSALAIYTNKVSFNTSTTATPSEGELCWNPDDGTLNLGMPGGSVVGQILQELFAPRSKAIGSNINNGQLVYVSGGSGSNPEMSLAKADASATSSGTIAMATEDIIQNQLGYYTAFGLVREVDTSSYSEGDQLYLSPTTAGGYTNVKPSAPNFTIKIGIVIRAHATEGIIFVSISQRTNNFINIRGLTAGYIPFADANGFLTEDSNLYWDNTNKRLGIGNTTPTGRIDLPAGTATAGSAPVKFNAGTALTTPETGALEFHNSRLYITNVLTRRAIDRSSDVLLATQTVTNTTTETTVLSDIIGANGFKFGNFSKLIASGDITSASAADTVTIRIKIDGTTIASLTSPGSVLSGDCFHIGGHATIRSVGVTGSIYYHVDLDINGTSSDSCGSQTIDTTGSNTISITAQWNNAKAGNIFNLTQAILEFKN